MRTRSARRALLVGFGPTFVPLPDFEIEALRSAVGQRRIEPHPYLVIGERVRIKAGSMAGMEGVLVRKKDNFRVVLMCERAPILAQLKHIVPQFTYAGSDRMPSMDNIPFGADLIPSDARQRTVAARIFAD